MAKGATLVPTQVYVSALTGSSVTVLYAWRASAKVTIKNFKDAAVQGAAVRGNFIWGGRSVGYVTASTGICTITSGNISTSNLSTTFKVVSVTGTNLSYDASRNTQSSVKILKP